MKYLLTSLLLLSIGIDCSAQNPLIGKWYSITSDRAQIVSYEFKEDSFITRKIDYQLKPVEIIGRSKIFDVISKNNKIYCINKIKNDALPYSLLIFSNVGEDSVLNELLPQQKVYYKDIKSINNFISADTVVGFKLNVTLFSWGQLEKLKSLKPLSTINKDDFKNYLLSIVETKKALTKYEQESGNKSGMNAMYLFNRTKVVLSNLGYSPFFADKDFFEIMNKSKGDPELKPLIEEVIPTPPAPPKK